MISEDTYHAISMWLQTTVVDFLCQHGFERYTGLTFDDVHSVVTVISSLPSTVLSLYPHGRYWGDITLGQSGIQISVNEEVVSILGLNILNELVAMISMNIHVEVTEQDPAGSRTFRREWKF